MPKEQTELEIQRDKVQYEDDDNDRSSLAKIETLPFRRMQRTPFVINID